MNIDPSQNRPVVKSVGNAWVICDSKSRPGYKYYFNTFSGQSVWNLSPDEIEKAKKHTKALPISEIENCPEPLMDPPIEDIDSMMGPPQGGPSRIFNEPFGRQISNQFPNIFPMNFNINRIPDAPNMPVIWAHPPNNMGMAPTPVIYIPVPQASYQQPQQYTQNLPLYLNEELENKAYLSQRDNVRYRIDRGIDTRDQQRFVQRNTPQRSNYEGSDLRQKLIRKRCRSESEPLYGCDEGNQTDFTWKTTNTDNKINIEEAPSKYNLSILEQLTPTATARNWIIVVDSEILLKNFAFLDRITDPEQDCYLLVPDHVMKELKHLVITKGDPQTRRILRFLTQQIEDDLVIKGKDMTNKADTEYCDDDTYKMLATCDDIADQNNVILLSNNVKYQKYKSDNSNVHILTLAEIKQMLNKPHPKKVPRNKSPTMNVKIIVPNDRVQDKVLLSPKKSKAPYFETPSLNPEKKDTTQIRPVQLFKQTSSDNTNLNDNTETETSRKIDHRVVKKPECNETPVPSKPHPHLAIKRNNKLSEPDKVNVESTQPKIYRWRKRTKSKGMSSATTDQATIETTKSMHCNKQQEIDPIDNPVPESRPTTPKPATAAKVPSPSRSSISSRKNVDISRPSIVIEETSTSGIISNTTLDSDDAQKSRTMIKKTVNVCKNVNYVMFEVVGQSMEEVLRTRREEWVLRFVQIMEETLKEILRVNSPFQSKSFEYTPSWAADLPELTKCIFKKFDDHFNVVDAANRLSFSIQMTSANGSVTADANFEPKQYMEMYSYGVYLIKALKSVTEDCEDLNMADESLKKLLYDIQNANQETGHNDVFNDELTDAAVNTAKTSNHAKDTEIAEVEKETNIQEGKTKNCEQNVVPHSQRQSQSQEKASQRKNESTFFSSLSLAKKSDNDKSPTQASQAHSTPNVSDIAQTSPQVSPLPKTPQQSPLRINTIQVSKELTKSSSDQNINNDKNTASSPIRTCFVRNFNSIPQFEELLSKKGKTDSNEAPVDEMYDNDDDYAGYADEYDDPNAEPYCDEFEDGYIGNEEEDLLEEAKPNEVDLSNHEASNEKFEWFVKEFTDEIRLSINRVLMLCKKFSGELKTPNGASRETQDELKTACASINSIKTALNSILDRDSTPENSIMHLLKTANLDDYAPSKENLLEYRNIITKCGDEVNRCYDKISLIMKIGGTGHLIK